MIHNTLQQTERAVAVFSSWVFSALNGNMFWTWHFCMFKSLAMSFSSCSGEERGEEAIYRGGGVKDPGWSWQKGPWEDLCGALLHRLQRHPEEAGRDEEGSGGGGGPVTLIACLQDHIKKIKVWDVIWKTALNRAEWKKSLMSDSTAVATKICCIATLKSTSVYMGK